MQPSIALAYNSRGGNDLAGVGFGLSGFSKIHRCPRTPVHDGMVGNVEFSSADKLCLDGERLVLVEGTGAYGASGSQYRTEIDRFARITLHGDINGLISNFEVERKSGQVDYYGGQTASESYTRSGWSSDARTLNWWLHSTVDRQGNFILYSYSWISAHFVPVAVYYTAGGAGYGDRSVVIDYEPRPDPSTRYLGGNMLHTLQRIQAITSYVDGAVVRRYELGYGAVSPATGRSLLRSVTECTSNPCAPGTSLPPTTFTYQDAPAVFEGVGPLLNPDGREDIRVQLGDDYDGDGTRDLIWSDYPGVLGGQPEASRVYFSGGSYGPSATPGSGGRRMANRAFTPARTCFCASKSAGSSSCRPPGMGMSAGSGRGYAPEAEVEGARPKRGWRLHQRETLLPFVRGGHPPGDLLAVAVA